MAAPYHLIEEKLEDAFAAALLTEYTGTVDAAGLISGGDLAGFYLFKGFSLLDIVPPYISIVCDESRPSEDGLAEATGNQLVQLRAKVCGHRGDTTRASHSAIAGKIKDFIYASNLEALLNAEAVTDLTVTRTYPQATTRRIEDAQLCTETTVAIKAQPS